MNEAQEKQWRELSEEVLSGMKEWRLAHPKATFREIEDAVAERMSRLEAKLVEGTAQESQQRKWSQQPEAEQPRCPVCELILRERGEQTRTLQGRGGKNIRLKREYGTCPNCGAGLFPPG
jgi:hypothetical protein